MNTGSAHTFETSDAILRRVRRGRMLDRIRHCTEPALVLALHASLLFLILLLSNTTSTKKPDAPVEIQIVELDPLHLDPLDDKPLEKMTQETFDPCQTTLPPPDEFTPPPLPEAMDFASLPPAPSPVLLKGVSLMNTDVSAAQLSRGSGTLFGHEKQIGGDLRGALYDLKRDSHGNPRTVDYTRDVRSLVEKRFSQQALHQFYHIPKPLFLSRLFQPYIPASKGPEAFDAANLMEPRQWIVHYTGQFQNQVGGKYRFAGDFDDILIVFVNGKIVLEANWSEPITDFRPTENIDKYISYTTKPITYGSWFELEPLKPAHIDILIGENPGGWMGGFLLMEYQNYDYDKDPTTGRPILPLFSLHPLSNEDQTAIRKIASENHFAIAELTPVMGVREDMKAFTKASAHVQDVPVHIE